MMFANNKNVNILPLFKAEAHSDVDIIKSVTHKNIRVKGFMLKYVEICFRYCLISRNVLL